MLSTQHPPHKRILIVEDCFRARELMSLILGEDGTLFVSRGTILASDARILAEPLKEDPKVYDGRPTNHMQNFVDCVKSRKAPICEAEIGHRSISVAHLGVIAVRMGQPLKWNPDKEQFAGEYAKEANKWLVREMRKPYDYSFIG